MTNNEIYDSVINEMPDGVRDNFPSYQEAIKTNLMNINMNIFIETLVNKIGKMLYLEQHFINPYETLYNGSMPYGYSIEELFMESPTVIDLLENFENSVDETEDIFNTTLPKFHGIVSNSQLTKKSKVSISEKRLKSAFYSENGLERLLATITNEIRTSMDKEKYREIEYTLNEFAIGKDYANNVLNFKQKPNVVQTTDIVKSIIETVEKFTLPSDEFNPAKVENQCSKDDIVIFVEPTVYAEIMSKPNKISEGYYNIRSVKELPTHYNSLSGEAPIECLAVIMDKRLLPVTLNYSGVEIIENPNSLELEYFYYECFNLPLNTYSNYTLLVK